ncbi:glycosyltransferase [Neisseria gonorrhoeae]|uniref:glycosyltransferase n=1 Tax=Neisseria gonorrhoeae TaxID=485 RepID=UPI003D9A6C8E
MAGVCQKSPKLKSRPPCLRLQNIEKFQIDFFGIEFIFGNRITCIPHQAVGRAVITTDVPGCRETVADKVNGFLIEPWNPRILAEKMIYFIENRAAVRLMGNASYAIAKDKFDAEKVDLKFLDILKA